MFNSATAFNHPLGSWQVGQVTSFREMFRQASAMNQDISGWNVSQARDMSFMFYGSDGFGKCNTMALDTSACPNMAVHDSFEAQNPLKWTYSYSAKTHLGDALTKWTINATSALERFGSISDWDVGAITDMSKLVYNKRSFDEDIDAWDVSKVTSMYQMFRYARAFNQPVEAWDVGQVTTMQVRRRPVLGL